MWLKTFLLLGLLNKDDQKKKINKYNRFLLHQANWESTKSETYIVM